jgi:hypothetical protein
MALGPSLARGIPLSTSALASCFPAPRAFHMGEKRLKTTKGYAVCQQVAGTPATIASGDPHWRRQEPKQCS